jgi:hypothetical protein
MENEDEQKANSAIDEYLAKVKQSVEAAEKHLGVPAGTISSIPNDPDFTATVKTYAVIEPMLNDIIMAKAPPSWVGVGLGQSPNEKFRTFVTKLNMSGKLRLAEAFGLIAKDQINFIEAVTRVRNRYAHNVKNMHRSLPEILTEEQLDHGRIVEHLTGMQPTLSDEEILRWLMYYRLADYLADALHTLPPPPPPEGGLFGNWSQQRIRIIEMKWAVHPDQ